MFRPAISDSRLPTLDSRPRSGYTLIEILVATTLSLLLLSAVVLMFGKVGRTITESRSMLAVADRLRSTATLLQKDLEGVTVAPGPQGIKPPVRPEDGQGYLEIVEGPIMATRSGVHPNILHNTNNPPLPSPYPIPINREQSPASTNQVRFQENGQWVTYDVDTSVGDFDDILLFTTRSKEKPFVGRIGTGTIQSDIAEVAWFIRGRKLYRRVLLVAPESVPNGTAPNGYYASNDISVHYNFIRNQLAGNTLSDLSRRECRFAHPIFFDTLLSNTDPPKILFPCDVRCWGQLRLPTLLETSFPWWPAGCFPGTLHNAGLVQWTNNWPGLVIPPPYPTPAPTAFTPPTTDFWKNLPVRDPEYLIRNGVTFTNLAHPNNFENVKIRFSNPTYMLYNASVIPSDPAQTDQMLQTLRYSDDVVLENVIGFDVKVWDPGAPLFYLQTNSGTGKDEVWNPNNLPAGANPQVVSMNDIPYDPNEVNQAPNGNYANYTVGYGAYVDLGYWLSRFPAYPWDSSHPMYFGGMGLMASGLGAYDKTNGAVDPTQARVYDTWSTHYENTIYNPLSDLKTATPHQPDPAFPALFPGRGNNGFDDDVSGAPGFGTVDDPGETHVPPPYPAPLRGIQVKIRVFDPDSRQILERTIVQDFLPR